MATHTSRSIATTIPATATPRTIFRLSNWSALSRAFSGEQRFSYIDTALGTRVLNPGRRQDTGAPSTSDPVPSSPHGHLPLTIQPEYSLGQTCQPHTPLASQSSVPATIDCNGVETERPDRVENRSKSKYQRRLTDEQSRDIISLRERQVPLSYQTIADDIGCSKSTAWRRTKKYERQTKLIQKYDP
ncbi:MAG: hypothetical protein J3Q66DRAFT_367431 [Benniella sp.]|nr:MAG: hypothetical protein J3Q66DRAFT_367431 [Benniella sp.]